LVGSILVWSHSEKVGGLCSNWGRWALVEENLFCYMRRGPFESSRQAKGPLAILLALLGVGALGVDVLSV
jgi:hypothetical protein